MKTAHRNAAHAKRRYQADPAAMWKEVARTTGFNDSEQTACALPVRVAWESMRSGKGTAEDAKTLADVIAICIMAAQNMDALVQETIEAGRVAFLGITDRFERIGRFGVDSASLLDVPPVVDFYEELLRVATLGQMETWLAAVRQVKGGVRELMGVAA